MKKIFILIFINLFLINSTNALDDFQKEKIQNVYNIFKIKIEKKYNSKKELEVFNNFDLALKKQINKKDLAADKKEMLDFLFSLNRETIETLKLKSFYSSNNNEDIIIEVKKIEPLVKENSPETNEKIFYEEYEKNNSYEIDNYEISKEIKKLYNKDGIFLENWVWYYYKIWNYNFFEKPNLVTIETLEENKIDINKTVLFFTDLNILWFANNPEKIKLISDKIIYWIPNKYSFLLEIKDDTKYLKSDYDNIFEWLKNKTLELTKWLKKEDKIEKIYYYILDNNKYTQEINLEDKKIFSGIELYKNWDWVCEWYIKLFMYMLSFAWVWDVSTIRGYVVNVPGFPDVWHWWVKIWDKYYDITFDDPTWITKTKTKENYKYFALPKDIFYTNKFDYNTLPENFKTASQEYINNYVNTNLFNLVKKYENDDYLILRKAKFKYKNNFNATEDITISNLYKAMPLYTVKNNTFIKDWKEYFISKVFYYKITNSTLDWTLEQINYDTSNYYFFKRYNSDWNYEYRLWYDLEIE